MLVNFMAIDELVSLLLPSLNGDVVGKETTWNSGWNSGISGFT